MKEQYKDSKAASKHRERADEYRSQAIRLVKDSAKEIDGPLAFLVIAMLLAAILDALADHLRYVRDY